MKQTTFFNGVLVALVLAFLSSVAFVSLMPLFGSELLFRTLVPFLGFTYIVYLFSRSAERVGRVTTLALWGVIAVAAWIFAQPFAPYVLIHVGAVWLIRSLYFYSRLTPALIDLGLNAVAMGTAVWAIGHSGSVFLAVWCFFLVQALFVAIPTLVGGKATPDNARTNDGLGFQQARHRAEAALRQLFAQ